MANDTELALHMIRVLRSERTHPVELFKVKANVLPLLLLIPPRFNKNKTDKQQKGEMVLIKIEVISRKIDCLGPKYKGGALKSLQLKVWTFLNNKCHN